MTGPVGDSQAGGSQAGNSQAGGGRVALVTGAAGRIGTALGALLPAAGFAVVGVDHPAATPAPTTAGWWGLDLADPEVGATLRRAIASLDRLDLVVNGAGITALGDLESTDAATFRQVMAVNFHGAVEVTRAALPALRATRGHVIAISSVAGHLPVVGRPAYVGAKHALTGTFRALGAELDAEGVAVTVVHPTFLATPVGEAPPDADRSVTGHPITAEDVARAIVRTVVHRQRTGAAPERIHVGRTAHLADLVHRVAPSLAVRLAARSLHS